MLRTRPSLHALAVVVACLAPSCAPREAESWPPGTVFVMDGEPITVAQIDELADTMVEVAPSYSAPHRRRVALTDVLIPRARARSLAGAERDAARRRLEAAIAEVEAGAISEAERVVGPWRELGLLTWLALRSTPVEEWTPIFEAPGTFASAKLISRDGNPIPGHEVFDCWLLWEHYTDGEFTKDPAQFGGHLEVVAEDADTWRSVLPALWLYELEGNDR